MFVGPQYGIASCHTSGAYNFEVAPVLFKKLGRP